MPADLGRRLAVSSVLMTILALLVFYAMHPFVKWVMTAVIALLVGVGCWEYQRFARFKGIQTVFALPFLAALVPFATLLGHPVPLVVGAYIVLTLFHFKQNEGAIVELAISTFALLYIAVPLSMQVSILYEVGREGRLWFLYLIAVTKMTDVGGYFGGSFFGKMKLAPKISPSKTVEGAFAGLVAALVTSYAFHSLFGRHSMDWLWLGLAMGCLAQLGDLAESLLKRDAGLKDSNVVPGLGGVLDTVDSLLFTTPIVFAYLL